jgi:vacuolar-type H+-ATPase subunit E/Vma4
MKDDLQHAPEDSIVRKILADGRAQAERALEGAKRSAEAETRKAQAEAEKIRKQVLDQAGRRAQTIRSKQIATARIESKRAMLKAREAAVAKVFEIIRGELEKLRQNRNEYRRALGNLAAQAVAAVDEPEVTLKIGKQDAELADGDFINRAANEARSLRQGEIKIEVVEDADLTDGGCVALSKKGHVIFDNTFKRRLERMEAELRAEIVNEVVKADG